MEKTITPPTTDTTPRAWVGCLHCYNEGRLVGEWFDAAAADLVTLADVHEGSGFDYAECEELWVFDHENIPVRGELDPLTAAAWGRCLTEVYKHFRPALVAWVRSGDYVAEGNSELPCIPDFIDRYCGEWESFSDYARNLAYDTGLLEGIPEEIAWYFDWRSWTRDLAFDYTTHDNPEGGVFVFRDL